MKGKITIEASDHGLGISCHMDDISILDKFELMHSLATSLHMDYADMLSYLLMESSGAMKKAETQIKCTTDEQLQSLLRGEEPEGITINMTELRRQLNES